MYTVIKRCIDIVGAGLGLIVLSPVLAVVAVAIWWDMGRSVMFRQMRPGLNGQPFNMYKFRTMSNKRDSQGNLLPDKQRLTPLGKILRKTSLDEFPELFTKGRYEPGGTATFVDAVPGALYPGTGPAARGEAGDNRLGAGKRAQCH